MDKKEVQVPMNQTTVESLKAGDEVLLSGAIFTARDAAHKRMDEALKGHQALPINLKDQVIYYVGPTPAKPEDIIGAAGPTTSSRMDKYTPPLLEQGLNGMIGKGYRSQEVICAIQKYKAVYFTAIGGSGALLSKCIKSVEIVAYEDLGTEAIRKITIEQFPVVVVNDSEGNDWFSQGQKQFREKFNLK